MMDLGEETYVVHKTRMWESHLDNFAMSTLGLIILGVEPVGLKPFNCEMSDSIERVNVKPKSGVGD